MKKVWDYIFYFKNGMVSSYLDCSAEFTEKDFLKEPWITMVDKNRKEVINMNQLLKFDIIEKVVNL